MIFDFMKWKNLTISISGVIIIVGLIFAFAFNGLNYDTDFAGGTTMQFFVDKDKAKDIKTEDVRKLVMDTIKLEPTVQRLGETGFEIKSKQTTNENTNNLKAAISEKYGVDPKNINSAYTSPSVGNDLKSAAIWSTVWASFLILLYIAWRFEVLTGVAAIASLLHDIFIMLAVYAIFKVPVNASFIAAMLTVLGYSINDTVIIFDRIRENKRNTNLRRESYEMLVNKSISQTFVRSVNTVMTVLITLVVLYIMGVQSIKEFAFPLLIGIVSGMYSSIFIAAPLWLTIHNMLKAKPKRVA